MTTPHPEEPAEGPVEVPDLESPGGDDPGTDHDADRSDDEPSNPDKTGASIDTSDGPADLA